MQGLEPEERSEILKNVAASLKSNQAEIFSTNKQDLEKAYSDGMIFCLQV